MIKSSNSKFTPIASALPDIPRWVETRGLLLSGRCKVYGFEDGESLQFVVQARDFGLICVVGKPPPSAIQDALSNSSVSVEILANDENSEYLDSILGNWQKNKAFIQQLKGAFDWNENIDSTVKFVSNHQIYSIRDQSPELAEEL